MARGWESKAVEDQQQDARERQRGTMTAPVDPAAHAARASLMLARTRALADLQLARAPAHRTMLERAIADLDARLAQLP
jgi:hypothetical protein